MNRTYWVCTWVLVAVAFIASLVFYAQLPDRIPIHWNIQGKVDGWGPKSTVWLMPGVMVGLIGLFALLPAISPKPFELEPNNTAYRIITLATVALMGYIHALSLWAAVQPRVDVGRAIVGGVMLMLAVMGNVMGKIKRNLYVGVRTPWTLANDRVWADTHRVAAWWFVGAGLAGFVVCLVGLPIWAALIPLAPAIIWPILFSYLHYKRLERTGQLSNDMSTAL